MNPSIAEKHTETITANGTNKVIFISNGNELLSMTT